MSFCTVIAICAWGIETSVSFVCCQPRREMLFHKLVAEFTEQAKFPMLRVVVGAGIWIPFPELVPGHAVIPLAASTCVSEKVFMLWAAMAKVLRGKSCVSGSLEHPTGLTVLHRRQDFAQLVILCRIVPRPVVPAASSSHNHCFSGKDGQRQCCYSVVTQGNNCLKHLCDFLKGDQKTVAALGDRLRLMP